MPVTSFYFPQQRRKFGQVFGARLAVVQRNRERFIPGHCSAGARLRSSQSLRQRKLQEDESPMHRFLPREDSTNLRNDDRQTRIHDSRGTTRRQNMHIRGLLVSTVILLNNVY